MFSQLSEAGSSNVNSHNLESIRENQADSLTFTLPEYYRQSTSFSSESSDSSENVCSPILDDSPAMILFPSIDLCEAAIIKKVANQIDSDPVNMTDNLVYITRSRLDELEYIETNVNKIIALNLQKYIESEESEESGSPEESGEPESNP